FFFSSRRRHTRSKRDWSSDVCSSDLSESDSGPASYVGSSNSDTIADVRIPTTGSKLGPSSSVPIRHPEKPGQNRCGNRRGKVKQCSFAALVGLDPNGVQVASKDFGHELASWLRSWKQRPWIAADCRGNGTIVEVLADQVIQYGRHLNGISGESDEHSAIGQVDLPSCHRDNAIERLSKQESEQPRET